MKFSLFVCLSALTLSLVWSGAYGLPKGRPFIELNDQIVEVRGILRTMEERFTGLLGRIEVIEHSVDRNSAAILALETESTILREVVENLTFGLETISDAQNTISLRIDALEAEIELNGDVLGILEQEIVSLNEVITLLDSDLEESTGLLSERISENQLLIGILSQRQDELSEQLALKQNLTEGRCPGGEALVGLEEDGSLLCQSFLDGSLLKTISKTGVYKVVQGGRYTFDMGRLGCNNLIGGGVEVPRQVQSVRKSGFNPNQFGTFGYQATGVLDTAPWHPDYAEPGSEIYWKFWVSCLVLPETFVVKTVEE